MLRGLGLGALLADRRERKLGVGARQVVAARHAAVHAAGDDAADALDLAARALAQRELLLRGEQAHEPERRDFPRFVDGLEELKIGTLDLAFSHPYPRRALPEDRNRQLGGSLVLRARVEDRAIAARRTRAADREARVGEGAGRLALGTRRLGLALRGDDARTFAHDAQHFFQGDRRR